MKLQPASGSRSRRLPGGRQREAQASRRQSPGRRLQGSDRSEVARQQRKVGRQLKRFIGRRFGGFVVRPDQSSDEVPQGRQVEGERRKGVPAAAGRNVIGSKAQAGGLDTSGTATWTFRPPEPEG